MLMQFTWLVSFPSFKPHNVLVNPNNLRHDSGTTTDTGASKKRPSTAAAASPPAVLSADHDLAQMSLTSAEGALTTCERPDLAHLALCEESTFHNVDQEIRRLALLST